MTGGVSVAVIHEYLRGMDYPSKKDGILQKARQNNAPDDVINVLNQIPDQQYNSAADVSKVIGVIE
jgi:hypothetical protein